MSLSVSRMSLVYLVEVGGDSATLGFSSEPGAAGLGSVSTLTLQCFFFLKTFYNLKSVNILFSIIFKRFPVAALGMFI